MVVPLVEELTDVAGDLGAQHLFWQGLGQRSPAPRGGACARHVDGASVARLVPLRLSRCATTFTAPARDYRHVGRALAEAGRCYSDVRCYAPRRRLHRPRVALP